MFALHQRLFSTLAQDQVYATVWAAAAGFGDAVTLTSKPFTDQLFELLPTEAIYSFAGLGGSFDVFKQCFTTLTPGNRTNHAEQTYKRNEVSPNHGGGAPQLAEHHARHVSGLDVSGNNYRTVGYGVQNQPGEKTDPQTDPPRQAGKIITRSSKVEVRLRAIHELLRVAYCLYLK